MPITLTRTIFLFFIIMLFLRLMGKRQLGQLQPYEFVSLLIISELVSVSMQDIGLPIMNSLLPLCIIAILQILLSLLNMKSQRSRRFFCGVPTVIIKDGRIQERKLRSLRMNLNDLLEELRTNGYFDITDIDCAMMETNGSISILPKAEKRPLTPQDMGIKPGLEGPCYILVLDGQINHRNMDLAGVTQEELRNQVQREGVSSLKDIFLASCNQKGEIFYQLKESALTNKGGQKS